MEHNTPLARPDGVHVPLAAAATATPPLPVAAAEPVPGAIQQSPAPAVRRSRTPNGPFRTAPPTPLSGASPLLELPAAYPMFTEQRRVANTFVPDAQLLFHVLSMCDQSMNNTDRFIRSANQWIPIVSQLYISVLWHVMILKVFVTSNQGSDFADFYDQLSTHLRIDECLIPGPLVPFFQALASTSSPFEWFGPIVPSIPGFAALWDAENFRPRPAFARQLPIPAIILDQLHAFATSTYRNENNAPYADTYTVHQWYRGVFSRTAATTEPLNRIGPQLCGSLYTPHTQHESARGYWAAALSSGITRVNADGAALSNYAQLLGLVAQDGTLQTDWFASVSNVMQRYCQHFNGSAPLKSIENTGLGAVAVRGYPANTTAARNWFYPDLRNIEPFTSTRFLPRREIPSDLDIYFRHAHPNLDETSEQSAVISHTNIVWSEITVQNNWNAVQLLDLYDGDYWLLSDCSESGPVRLKSQFVTLIASRYHQLNSNRAE